jgi:hypothetical protein
MHVYACVFIPFSDTYIQYIHMYTYPLFDQFARNRSMWVIFTAPTYVYIYLINTCTKVTWIHVHACIFIPFLDTYIQYIHMCIYPLLNKFARNRSMWVVFTAPTPIKIQVYIMYIHAYSFFILDTCIYTYVHTHCSISLHETGACGSFLQPQHQALPQSHVIILI